MSSWIIELSLVPLASQRQQCSLKRTFPFQHFDLCHRLLCQSYMRHPLCPKRLNLWWPQFFFFVFLLIALFIIYACLLHLPRPCLLLPVIPLKSDAKPRRTRPFWLPSLSLVVVKEGDPGWLGPSLCNLFSFISLFNLAISIRWKRWMRMAPVSFFEPSDMLDIVDHSWCNSRVCQHPRPRVS